MVLFLLFYIIIFRLLEAMGASSTDTEVTMIVKYFYLLASKPQKS